MITAMDAVHRTEVRPANPMKNFRSEKDTSEMLMYEELARARMREAERDAAECRQARQLSTARRWRRIATFSARRAASAESALRPGVVPAMR